MGTVNVTNKSEPKQYYRPKSFKTCCRYCIIPTTFILKNFSVSSWHGSSSSKATDVICCSCGKSNFTFFENHIPAFLKEYYTVIEPKSILYIKKTEFTYE